MARGADPAAAEFIEPTRASRRNIVVLFATALIVGITAIELLEAWIAELNKRPICEGITPFWILFTIGFGGIAVGGLWQAWIGHKALKLDRWPLPGTWVWRRTPIHRGSAVRWRAYAMFSVGILIAAMTAVAWAFTSTVIHPVQARCEAGAKA